MRRLHFARLSDKKSSRKTKAASLLGVHSCCWHIVYGIADILVLRVSLAVSNSSE